MYETRFFNDKLYKRRNKYYNKKNDVLIAKKKAKKNGFFVIINKSVKGYFLWIRKKELIDWEEQWEKKALEQRKLKRKDYRKNK